MNDAYLQIDGIKGESTDERHKDWIEIGKVRYSIYQPRAEVVSTGGGHTTGKADLLPITFTKLADISSPVLLQACATGKTISKVVFEFLRADGNGNPVPYFRIELENLLIASITPDSGDGGIITERVQLAFSKIQWKYVRQSIRGGTTGNSTGGWNCSTNRVC
jgi:type VI secretion system secreted protein Hcp